MEERRSSHMLRQIKEICEIVGIRTEEYARVTKKWLDVKSLARELNREKRYLGDRVFELFDNDDRSDIYEDITAKAIVGRIKNLEDSLAEYESEIDDIHESASTKTSGVRSRRRDDMVSDDDWEAPFNDNQDDDEDAPWDDTDIVGTEDAEYGSTEYSSTEDDADPDDADPDDSTEDDGIENNTVYTDIPEDEIEDIESESIEEGSDCDDESGESGEGENGYDPASGAPKPEKQ